MFGVSCVGFQVSGVRCRVSSFGIWGLGLRFRVSGVRCRV